MKDKLLATDMDGTVIPFENNPARTSEIQQFGHMLSIHPEITLAYVTGRHLELGLAGVNAWGLPEPDMFVCDVGTSIYFKMKNTWRIDPEFRALMIEAWHGRTNRDIAAILADIDEITPQGNDKQKEFKQSYYVSLDSRSHEIIERITTELHSRGVCANVIYSVDVKKNIGLVDVLPDNAAKDFSLRYLVKKLALPEKNVAYAGDSGNDLLAFICGVNAVVVNNTSAAVKAETKRMARKKGIEDKLYFAGTNHVRGVIEGCRHFNLFRY